MSPVYGYPDPTSNKVLQEHGGNVYALAEELGIDISDIIDFSASINPLGVPKSAATAIKKNIPYLVNYPDPEAKVLTNEIAMSLKIDPELILCGNGSTELFYLLMRTLSPESILTPIPSFSEYAKAFRIYKGDAFKKEDLKYFVLQEADSFQMDVDAFIKAMAADQSIEIVRKTPMLASPDMVFLCNPNNPTASMLSRQEVLRIADAARDLRCYLVVDEAFIDFCPEYSVASEVESNPHLIVIRSLTKFYALAGLRIGYGIFHPKLMSRIRRCKEPWTVNTMAQVAAIAALGDRAYAQQTFRVMAEEKTVLEDGFRALKIRYFPSAVNFYLLRFAEDEDIINPLRERAIMVRDCANFEGLKKGYVRVAVKSNRDNMRLLKELLRLCVV